MADTEAYLQDRLARRPASRALKQAAAAMMLEIAQSPHNEGYVFRKTFPDKSEDENPYRPGTSAAESWLAGVTEAETEALRGGYDFDPAKW